MVWEMWHFWPWCPERFGKCAIFGHGPERFGKCVIFGNCPERLGENGIFGHKEFGSFMIGVNTICRREWGGGGGG